MNENESADMRLARTIVAAFSGLPNVEAAALGGSHAAGCADDDSDVDVYIFTSSAIPEADRRRIAADLGVINPRFNPCPFLDASDAWQDSSTGVKADVVYWDTSWCDKLLDRVLVDCIADNGYSTSHWYTLKNCRCLYDRAGWFAGMRERSGRPYPDRLQRAIIERGCPTMRICRNQIALAIRREDWVSINHRLTAMLEGYFDVLFALNRALHPGEKRLLELAPKLCAKCPPDMQAQVERVIRSAAAPDETMLADIDKLIKGIEVLLPA